MGSVAVNPEFVGVVGTTNVYRIDLSQFGLATIQSITLQDDGYKSGATGASSGADIDFIKISQTYTNSPWEAATLPGADVFDYYGGVVFNPGFLTPWLPEENAVFNAPNLFGTTSGNIYNSNQATLGDKDARENASFGTLSLGEGGQVSFLLKNALATGLNGSPKQYLYFGEDEVIDAVRVTLSEERVAPPLSGLTLWGDDLPNIMQLGSGFNFHLGAGKDVINGLGGDDTIMSGAGADKLYGGLGHDRLYGEHGNDRIYGDAQNDCIYGGYGLDRLYGGSGRDAFVFDTKLGSHRTDRKKNFDKIIDFNPKHDSVWLENAIFKKLGKKGSEDRPLKLKSKYFEVGEADDRNDYILYNKKSGILSYDVDGSGSKKAVEFAQVKKNLKMTYKDFFII